MTIIANRGKLVSHGNSRGREIIVDIIEYALQSVNSYVLTRKTIHVEDDVLYVDQLKYDLSKIRNIFVVGAGKASFSIAQAVEDVLGARIRKGVVNVKRGEKRRLKHIKIREAGHPVPDEEGYEGAKEILEVAQEAGEGDLVFCLITGGASALMPLPYEGISLDDKKRVNELLLKCGATIDEINAVRNHISAIKGGRLAKYIHPAETVNLIVMDEVAGLPWGPSVPDPSTFWECIRILKKYDLWSRVPESARHHLENGLNDPAMETLKPRDFENMKVHNIILADNQKICQAAKEKAEQLGLRAVVLTTLLEGESREAGIVLATIAREVEARGRPIEPPCVLICGGETNVRMAGECGKGGPSQEFALGSSLKLDGSRRIVIASVDTDGTDGPTDVAGGIVDGYTLERAREKGLDIYGSLMKHDAYVVLDELGDAIRTGPTETNVMDLDVVVVS